MRQSRPLPPLAAAALLLAAAPAAAIDVADGKLSINGSGEWAYEVTDHGRYFRADDDGDWTTAMFDLLVVARPAPDLALQAQMGWDPASFEGEERATCGSRRRPSTRGRWGRRSSGPATPRWPPS